VRRKTMPEVKSAKAATEIALAYLKRYYTFSKPKRAVKEGVVWSVEVDVGVWATKIAKVKIHAATGDILEYTVPS
jgi:hypothetical protein